MAESKIHSNIIFSQNITEELKTIIEKYPKNKVFLLVEENTQELCLPLINELIIDKEIKTVTISAGEKNKKITSVEQVWQFLSSNGADRKSLLINLGGGMLTDLGGFAASTFKRGLDFINIPTTLLAQVDASLGGKTGFNFNGLKNEIGVFQEPVAVIINTNFLKTIDHDNFLSGYAEMIKHGFIKSKAHWDELQKYNLDAINYKALQKIIAHSVAVKEWFVTNDPTEKNVRKALNLGHTVGHAFESYAMKSGNPILHGHAVIYGIIVELFLSAEKCDFNKTELIKISKWLVNIYGKFEFSNNDYEALFELMTHDKKNEEGRINFTLIPEIGDVLINQNCTKDEIFEALDFYQNL